MEIEYIAKVTQNGHLSIDSEIVKQFKQGELIKVRLSKLRKKEKVHHFSRQAQNLIELLENAPDRGGFGGNEITREFIHEK